MIDLLTVPENWQDPSWLEPAIRAYGVSKVAKKLLLQPKKIKDLCVKLRIRIPTDTNLDKVIHNYYVQSSTASNCDSLIGKSGYTKKLLKRHNLPTKLKYNLSTNHKWVWVLLKRLRKHPELVKIRTKKNQFTLYYKCKLKESFHIRPYKKQPVLIETNARLQYFPRITKLYPDSDTHWGVDRKLLYCASTIERRLTYASLTSKLMPLCGQSVKYPKMVIDHCYRELANKTAKKHQDQQLLQHFTDYRFPQVSSRALYRAIRETYKFRRTPISTSGVLLALTQSKAVDRPNWLWSRDYHKILGKFQNIQSILDLNNSVVCFLVCACMDLRYYSKSKLAIDDGHITLTGHYPNTHSSEHVDVVIYDKRMPTTDEDIDFRSLMAITSNLVIIDASSNQTWKQLRPKRTYQLNPGVMVYSW